MGANIISFLALFHVCLLFITSFKLSQTFSVRVGASITLLSSYSKLTAAAFIQVKTFPLVQSVKGALTPPKFLMILL